MGCATPSAAWAGIRSAAIGAFAAAGLAFTKALCLVIRCAGESLAHSSTVYSKGTFLCVIAFAAGCVMGGSLSRLLYPNLPHVGRGESPFLAPLVGALGG